MKLIIFTLIVGFVVLAGLLIFGRKKTSTLEARLVRARHAIEEAAKPNSRPVIVNDDYPDILMYKSLVPQLQAESQSTFIVALPSFEIKLHIPHKGSVIIDNCTIENSKSGHGIIVE